MFTEETHIKKMIRCEHYGDIFYFNLNKLVSFSLEQDVEVNDEIWYIRFVFENNEKSFEYDSITEAVEEFEKIEKQLC